MELQTNAGSKAVSQYKVTIIIPVYNVAAYIERSLLSAFNQTFQSIEYLLIDDRGTDNSIPIARSIIANHPRKNDIRIIEHERNIGAGATKNTGIKNATGEYIFFMDSDDEISADAIEKLYNAIEKTGADFVIGSYESIDKVNSGKKWEWKFAANTIKGENAVADYFFNGGFYVMTWNRLLRRSFLLQYEVTCIDNNIHEDEFFSLQIALNARAITTIPDITYFYIFRDGSTMSEFKERNFRDIYNTVEKMIEYSKRYKNKSIYRRIIYHIYGFKFSTLKKLKKNKTVSPAFKEEYLQKLSRKFLTIREIWSLPNAKLFHKIKYTISYFPYNQQLFLLELIKRVYGKE